MEFQEALFTFNFIFLFFSGVRSTTFTIKNNCPYTIWPATQTGNGNQPSTTGFELPTKASLTVDVPDPWSGRFWARTECSTDSTKRFTCNTANCASGQVSCNGFGAIPPSTLVEFTLASNNGRNFYDISLVDGFNLPVSVAPQGGLGGCTTASCHANVNAVCPPELAVKGFDGRVIACKGACLAFHSPEYCCTGYYGSPGTCLATNYSKVFKDYCPQAYSYAFDDKTSLFTCSGGASYVITFCP